MAGRTIKHDHKFFPTRVPLVLNFESYHHEKYLFLLVRSSFFSLLLLLLVVNSSLFCSPSADFIGVSSADFLGVSHVYSIRYC
eukprot:UN02722